VCYGSRKKSVLMHCKIKFNTKIFLVLIKKIDILYGDADKIPVSKKKVRQKTAP